MSTARGGLGRGLAALIPSGPEDEARSHRLLLEVGRTGRDEAEFGASDALHVDVAAEVAVSSGDALHVDLAGVEAVDSAAMHGSDAHPVRVLAAEPGPPTGERVSGPEQTVAAVVLGRTEAADGTGVAFWEPPLGAVDRLDEELSSEQPASPSRPGGSVPAGKRNGGDEADGGLKMIPVDSLQANARQPRLVFDDNSHEELVASVRAVGILQPLVVRPAAGDRYEIVMGERRWRAAMAAGMTEVPAIVRATDDLDMLRDALIENIHRDQLNALEEAAAYAQLIEDLYLTHEQLAERLSRSRSHVTNALRLLTLPGPVQRRVAAGVLSAGHARALLSLEDPVAIEELAGRVVAEGLSVRAVEELTAVRRSALPRTRRTGRPGVSFGQLESTLSEHFETRVRVELGRTKGRMIVEFGSVDDLNRIVTTMAAGASSNLTAGLATEQTA